LPELLWQFRGCFLQTNSFWPIMATKIENRGPELMAVNITFLTAALISMILRAYVRSVMVKAFGIDDWLMVVGTVCWIAILA
jgi:hypothetical protein